MNACQHGNEPVGCQLCRQSQLQRDLIQYYGERLENQAREAWRNSISVDPIYYATQVTEEDEDA